MFSNAAFLSIKIENSFVFLYVNVQSQFILAFPFTTENFHEIVTFYTDIVSKSCPLPNKLHLYNFTDVFTEFGRELNEQGFDGIEVISHWDQQLKTDTDWIARTVTTLHPTFGLQYLLREIFLYNVCGGANSPMAKFMGSQHAAQSTYWWELPAPAIVNRLCEIATHIRWNLIDAVYQRAATPDTFFNGWNLIEEGDQRTETPDSFVDLPDYID
jgi:hypothetical protein